MKMQRIDPSNKGDAAVVGVRMTLTQQKHVRAMAAKHKTSLSGFIRDLIDKHIEENG